MKKNWLLLLLFFSLIPQGMAARQLLDRVVAIVNDEIITQSELDVLLRPLYEQFKTEFKGQELVAKLNEARQKILNQLVEDRLVFQEAKKRGLAVDEAEIDSQVEAFKKKFPSETALEDTLKRDGFTLTEMRERFRRQAIVRKLQDIEIRAKVVVSPGEVEEYYNTHPSEFSEQETIKVRSLTVKKSAEARLRGLADEESKNKIQSLREKILSGEDFGELAKLYSEDTLAKNGGLGDWTKHGDMIPAIDAVIFGLKPGVVSDVIETPMGYHLFRVEERREGWKRGLEQVREDILYKLYQNKIDDRFKEWIQELKQGAYISIH